MSTLKTWKKPKILKDTVTAAEVTATKKIIFVGTGVPVHTTSDYAYILEVKRGEIACSKTKHAYSTVSGAVVLYGNSSDYVLTAGDVVTIIGTYI